MGCSIQRVLITLSNHVVMPFPSPDVVRRRQINLFVSHLDGLDLRLGPNLSAFLENAISFRGTTATLLPSFSFWLRYSKSHSFLEHDG